MAKKQEITQTRARILIYLSVVHKNYKNVSSIAHKLDIDYAYVLRNLAFMKANNWLRAHHYKRKVFYELTDLAPLETARNAFNSGSLQSELMQYAQVEVEDPKGEADEQGDRTES